MSWCIEKWYNSIIAQRNWEVIEMACLIYMKKKASFRGTLKEEKYTKTLLECWISKLAGLLANLGNLNGLKEK